MERGFFYGWNFTRITYTLMAVTAGAFLAHMGWYGSENQTWAMGFVTMALVFCLATEVLNFCLTGRSGKSINERRREILMSAYMIEGLRILAIREAAGNGDMEEVREIAGAKHISLFEIYPEIKEASTKQQD